MMANSGPGHSFAIEVLGQMAQALQEENRLLRDHLGIPAGMPAAMFMDMQREAPAPATVPDGPSEEPPGG